MLESAVAWLGLLSGVVGICIAIYLMFVTPRQIPLRHIFAFFAVGSYLMLAHTSPLAPSLISSTLQAVALTGTLAVELLAFKWVLERSRRTDDDSESLPFVG